MSAILYLRRDDSGYVLEGVHCTAAEASDLILPFEFAVISKFDRSVVASDSRDKVAPYGTPRFAPDLAEEISTGTEAHQ